MTTRQLSPRKPRRDMSVRQSLDIIRMAMDDLKANGFSFNPRIVREDEFDLKGFKVQESEIPGCRAEYVDQRGPGIAGDDYHGTAAWPIGGGLLFVCDYST